MKVKDWYKQNKIYFKLSELNFIFKNLGIKFLNSPGGGDSPLGSRQLKKLKKIKGNRIKGAPLGFSLLQEDFFGFTFKLNSDTLIPRPETELLAEKAKELISDKNLKIVLDLCCGCGNIGISLDKLLRGKVKVYLSDLNLKALSAAKTNIDSLKSKAKIINSNLFSAFRSGSFDLIVTNPPYVESRRIKGGLLYEPKTALDGGKDGLIFLKKIIELGHRYLKNKGYLITEIGYNQKENIEKIIKRSNNYNLKAWIKDYGKNWRGVVLQKRG